MKKILFILKNPNHASSRFRVKEYMSLLEKDFNCDIFYAEYKSSSIQLINSIMKRLHYLKLFYIAKRYDLLFMQKPMSADKHTSIFFEKILTKLNNNLIFDLDDALFLENEKKIKGLIKLSSACICGNDYLAEFAKRFNENVHVIPTSISMQRYNISKKNYNDKITIGWTGTSGNYQFFTKTLIQSLKNILSIYDNVNFLFICDHRPNATFDFPYDFIKWNEESEIEDLQKIDIGIMPLKDSEWSKGKCGFKLIQYGGIAIASIASDVGVNNQVIKDNESGFLIQAEDQWIEKLKILIEDKEKRAEFGKNAQRHIHNNFSIEKNYPQLKNILQKECR